MFPDWLSSFTGPSVLQWVSGGMPAGSEYVLSRWLFLRLLGVVYLIAFISLWVQIKGLIGSNGILPVQEFLDAIRNAYGAERFYLVPTVFWVNASDIALHVVCALGVIASLTLIIGFIPMPMLIILWILYLSLTTAGQDFLSFQWDIFLLEVGFLAIFFAPTNLFPSLGRESAVSPLMLFLLWWLAFRFMFESGVVKLNSGDPTWVNLTALRYHYFTQPIPTSISWYMHHLPLWFHQLSTIVMYIVELVLPVCIFFGRMPRIAAFLGYTFLMIVITATGNYNFFTLLTVVLTIPLVPDAFWLKIFPTGLIEWLGYPGVHPVLAQPFAGFIMLLAALCLLIGGSQLLLTVSRNLPVPRFITALDHMLDPFRSINSYGLFRVMTKERPEIIIEGSMDGITWQAYEFRFKPSVLDRPPPFVEPHQPRLDWQMWFAALSHFDYTPWFQRFLVRLLEGSPDVLALLEVNPFPEAPPRYIRAQLYHYEFTTPAEKRATGNWWRRDERGMYSPVLSLQNGTKQQEAISN